jgi:excisionase family DNA binding protein
MSDSVDPFVQIRLSDLLSLQAAHGERRRGTAVQAFDPTPPPAPAAAATAEYLTTREAAVVLGVSAKCLEAWRAKGAGPPFAHVGRAVRYPTAELRAWVLSRS